MVGTGIFLKPGEMAAVGGSVSLVYAAWIAGGLLSLFGALSFAELGAAMPEAGGQYAYLRRGLGPVWGFLFGWMHSTVGESSSAASIAAGLARFTSFLIPALAIPIFSWHFTLPFSGAPYDFVFTWAQPAAAGAIILFTIINYLGVRLGGRVQVALTVLKIAAVLAIVAAGFWFGHGSMSHFHPFWPLKNSAGTLTAFLAALAAALWAYDGWEDLNRVGSEVQNPERNFPRALAGGTILVAVIYLLFSAVCFYALPFASVASSSHVASDVVESFAGPGAAFWITLAMIVAALGTLNSSIMSGARVPFAAARDRLFFSRFMAIDPRFQSPSFSLIVQGLLSTVLLIFLSQFQQFFDLAVFAEWMFYMLTASTIFYYRRKYPELKRPYRVWGYPVLPAIFILCAAAVLVSSYTSNLKGSLLGTVVILLGLPVMWAVRKMYGKSVPMEEGRMY